MFRHSIKNYDSSGNDLRGITVKAEYEA